MKPLFTQHLRYQFNWYRIVLYTVSIVLTGIYPVIVKGQMPETISDIDGNVYNIMTIGSQIWMAENLKTTRYNDVVDMENITSNTSWSNMTYGAYCWYNNDINNRNIYGALYNWFAVNRGNLCPIGWHAPSDAEWTTLSDYLGGKDVAGGKLKEVGLAHWISPNDGATNETGFTALPGGWRTSPDYTFNGIGVAGDWWSSTEYSADTRAAFRRFIYTEISLLGRF